MTDMHRTGHITYRKRRGFTLIELLLVVVIMGILMAVAIPSFDAFSIKGTRAAVPPLHSTLRLARQFAVTKRQPVWIIFPVEVTDAETNDISKLLRAYAVITTNSQAEKYEYLTDWKYLPKGVSFIEQSHYSGFNVISNIDTVGNATRFPFPSEADGAERMAAVMFKPNGKLYVYDDSSGEWTLGSIPNLTRVILSNARLITENYPNIQVQHIPGTTNLITVYNLTGNISVDVRMAP
jgi:prepilin-type N-terminal cleavage/methylation domain-containing protein